MFICRQHTTLESDVYICDKKGKKVQTNFTSYPGNNIAV